MDIGTYWDNTIKAWDTRQDYQGYVGYSSMVMAQRLRELGGRGSAWHSASQHIVGV